VKFIPIASVIRHKARVEAKLADAVAALRVADAKLGEAAEEYEGDSRDKADLMEARFNSRLFADMLEANETPTLPSRVFRAIASYANRTPGISPHVEGAILALNLAERSLESALELAEQLDGDEIDEAYEIPFAALGTIRQYGATLRCSALVFDQEAALDAIVAAKRTLAMSA
jgi:hypothetical protein